MNRQKAINKKFVRKLKQVRSRNAVKHKEPYISKADRAAMEMTEQEEVQSTETTLPEEKTEISQ